MDRRTKLWLLIQEIDPETSNLEGIAAEKAALDANEPNASVTRACGEEVEHQMKLWTEFISEFLDAARANRKFATANGPKFRAETRNCTKVNAGKAI